MKPIGGYFGLELPLSKSTYDFDRCTMLNSGSHALEYILKLCDSFPELVYLPYYTCDSVLEPLNRLSIKYHFYAINEHLEISSLPILKHNEYIIVNNYFAKKDAYINSLFDHYGQKMIVDNAQGFYYSPKRKMLAFSSPRKFFGVSDGGLAYTITEKKTPIPTDISFERCSHLLKRIDAGAESGFDDFRRNELLLSKEPLKRMSYLTENILKSINYDAVKARRRSNFDKLHSSLGASNRLDIPDLSTF